MVGREYSGKTGGGAAILPAISFFFFSIFPLRSTIRKPGPGPGIVLSTPDTYSLDSNSVVRWIALSNSTFEQQGPGEQGLGKGGGGGERNKREVGRTTQLKMQQSKKGSWEDAIRNGAEWGRGACRVGVVGGLDLGISVFQSLQLFFNLVTCKLCLYISLFFKRL